MPIPALAALVIVVLFLLLAGQYSGAATVVLLSAIYVRLTQIAQALQSGARFQDQ